MYTSRWPYRLLLIYICWFTASSLSLQVSFPLAQALYNDVPRSSNQSINARWKGDSKTVFTSIWIIWCHSTLLLGTFNIILLIPISVCLQSFPLLLPWGQGGDSGERLDGRKSQKGERNGEVEWCLAGRERVGTEANDVLLKRHCVLMGKKHSCFKDLITGYGTE